MIIFNIVIGLFNLLPIPPLDGSRIIGGFMPRETYLRWAALDQYGMFVVFGLFLLFNRQLMTIMDSGLEHGLRTISAIVGGRPMV
jgi:Zn-dependent protease